MTISRTLAAAGGLLAVLLSRSNLRPDADRVSHRDKVEPMKLCNRSIAQLIQLLWVAALLWSAADARAQIPPTQRDLAAYTGLHAAAKGDVAAIKQLAAGGGNLNARDGHGRTPLMV